MARIAVIGGTGYAGAGIVEAAVARGHEVTSFSRNPPAEPAAGVTYVIGSVLDDDRRTQAVADADVVIASLSPRGDMAGRLPGVYRRLAELAAQQDTRLGVIGGFGSLRAAPGGPRLAFGDDVPAEFVPESQELAAVVEDLQAAPEGLDWFYVSPPAVFGAFAPAEPAGAYRVGADVAVFDEQARQPFSAGDFAAAVVDEIERPAHRRAHFSVHP